MHSQSVIQLTTSGMFVCEYDSRKDAEEKTNISRAHIGQCCNNKRITAGGFLWVNKDQYDPTHNYSYEERKQIYYKKTKGV